MAGILAVCGDRLDRVYLERWAEVLGVSALWCALREKPQDP